MKDVYELKWKPFDAGSLAVSSASGVFLWRLNLRANINTPIRPSTLYSPQTWIQKDIKNVSAMDWSPCGTLLYITTKSDSKVVIWDVAKEFTTVLSLGSPWDVYYRSKSTITSLMSKNSTAIVQDPSPKGTKKIKISRSGLFLAQLLNSGELYVFDLQTSTKHFCQGGISSFCWINSTVLLYMKGPSALHIVQLTKTENKLRVREMRGQTSFEVIGGSSPDTRVLDVAIDPSWQRLVIHTTDNIGLYSLSYQPLVRIDPIGLVKRHEEKPVKFAWASQFKDGALLSVVFSSGKVLFVPCMLKEPTKGSFQFGGLVMWYRSIVFIYFSFQIRNKRILLIRICLQSFRARWIVGPWCFPCQIGSESDRQRFDIHLYLNSATEARVLAPNPGTYRARMWHSSHFPQGKSYRSSKQVGHQVWAAWQRHEEDFFGIWHADGFPLYSLWIQNTDAGQLLNKVHLIISGRKILLETFWPCFQIRGAMQYNLICLGWRLLKMQHKMMSRRYTREYFQAVEIVHTLWVVGSFYLSGREQ